MFGRTSVSPKRCFAAFAFKWQRWYILLGVNLRKELVRALEPEVTAVWDLIVVAGVW